MAEGNPQWHHKNKNNSRRILCNVSKFKLKGYIYYYA
nr:Transketolase N-terminal section [Leptospira interrogans serovar Copenhageni/Icterohaemorrhagiae]